MKSINLCVCVSSFKNDIKPKKCKDEWECKFFFTKINVCVLTLNTGINKLLSNFLCVYVHVRTCVYVRIKKISCWIKSNKCGISLFFWRSFRDIYLWKFVCKSDDDDDDWCELFSSGGDSWHMRDLDGSKSWIKEQRKEEKKQ